MLVLVLPKQIKQQRLLPISMSTRLQMVTLRHCLGHGKMLTVTA